MYLTLVASVTLFPIPVSSDLAGHYRYNTVNFVPFRSIVQTIQTNLQVPKQIFLQIFGNIILFFPLGILLQVVGKRKKGRNLLIAVGMAVFIEAFQGIYGWVLYGAPYRTVDIDDVILNTLGYWIGFGFYGILPKKWKEPFTGLDCGVSSTEGRRFLPIKDEILSFLLKPCIFCLSTI
ncbi:MAG: VanZ family protein [Clostridiales bacterium]|nr:VanZ family protein [Clostridiales bacterium]